jgi:hypothetical protein
MRGIWLVMVGVFVWSAVGAQALGLPPLPGLPDLPAMEDDGGLPPLPSDDGGFGDLPAMDEAPSDSDAGQEDLPALNDDGGESVEPEAASPAEDGMPPSEQPQPAAQVDSSQPASPKGPAPKMPEHAMRMTEDTAPAGDGGEVADREQDFFEQGKERLDKLEATVEKFEAKMDEVEGVQNAVSKTLDLYSLELNNRVGFFEEVTETLENYRVEHKSHGELAKELETKLGEFKGSVAELRISGMKTNEPEGKLNGESDKVRTAIARAYEILGEAREQKNNIPDTRDPGDQQRLVQQIDATIKGSEPLAGEIDASLKTTKEQQASINTAIAEGKKLIADLSEQRISMLKLVNDIKAEKEETAGKSEMEVAEKIHRPVTGKSKRRVPSNSVSGVVLRIVVDVFGTVYKGGKQLGMIIASKFSSKKDDGGKTAKVLKKKRAKLGGSMGKLKDTVSEAVSSWYEYAKALYHSSGDMPLDDEGGEAEQPVHEGPKVPETPPEKLAPPEVPLGIESSGDSASPMAPLGELPGELPAEMPLPMPEPVETVAPALPPSPEAAGVEGLANALPPLPALK